MRAWDRHRAGVSPFGVEVLYRLIAMRSARLMPRPLAHNTAAHTRGSSRALWNAPCCRFAGIAVSGKTGDIWLTGKQWHRMYHVELAGETDAPDQVALARKTCLPSRGR